MYDYIAWADEVTSLYSEHLADVFEFFPTTFFVSVFFYYIINL